VSDDPFVRSAREQISELDRSIFEAVNRRIELVRELKAYKDEHGISFVDTGREESMVAEQVDAARGPLSAEGLAGLYRELLALTKREL